MRLGPGITYRTFGGLLCTAMAAASAATACGDSYGDSPVPGVDAGPAEAPVVSTASLTLSVSPVELAIEEGASAKITAEVLRSPSMREPVQIAVSGLPEGVTASPPIALLGASESRAELTLVRARGTAPGEATLRVRAAGGALEASTELKARFPPPHGVLDPSFGDQGLVRTGQRPAAFRLAADGRLYIALNDGVPGTSITVTRHDPSGALDETWASRGQALASAPFSVHVLTVSAAGDVLVAGPGATKFYAVRFDAGGAWDASFGAAGVGSLSPPTDTRPLMVRDIAVRPSGRIFLLGTARSTGPAGDSTYSGQLLGTGDVDPQFHSPFASGEAHLFSLALASSENEGIYVALVGKSAGSYPTEMLHIDARGGPGFFDRKIIAEGREWQPLEIAALIRGTDGKLVLASGSTESGRPRIQLRRFDHKGIPDLTFGVAGRVETATEGASETALGALVSEDGTYVVGSSSGPDGRALVLLRFRSSGVIDSSFGSLGVLKLPLRDVTRAQIVLDPAKRIVIAAQTGEGLVLARVSP